MIKLLNSISIILIVFCLILISVSLLAAEVQAEEGENYTAQSPFLRVAIELDKSLSTFDNGVPQIQLNDLNPIFNVLSNDGGELAVGCISNLSTAPLVRVYVPPPPGRPVDKSISETNIIRIGEAMATYRDQFDQYTVTFTGWQENAISVINAAKRSIDSVLSLPVMAHRTDIVDAVGRVHSFFAEPGIIGSVPVKQFAIFCTDGQHDQTAHPPRLPDIPAVVIAVPGDNIGILELLQPLRFESPQAAIRYVVSNFKTIASQQEPR